MKNHAETVHRTQHVELKAAETTLMELSDFFRILGDTTRIRILSLLLDGEMNVTSIAAGIGVEQSAVSHQLRLLKAARLVKTRRQGKTVNYSLDDSHVERILSMGLDHVREKEK